MNDLTPTNLLVNECYSFTYLPPNIKTGHDLGRDHDQTSLVFVVVMNYTLAKN